LNQKQTTSQNDLTPDYSPAAGLSTHMETHHSLNKAAYPRVWLYGIILTVGFLFLHMKVVLTLISVWWHSYTYSYGFLIPIISLYLIWTRRNSLYNIPAIPNYIGGFVIFISGLTMLVMGEAGEIIAIQGISLVVTITGLVLFLLGKEFLRVLWLPIAYLLFMIPVWDVITDRFHTPFQNFSAWIGITTLQLMGIPAYRQDIYIELPYITLEVARVCSGVNNLIAVVALGIPLAHLAINRWTRKIVLVIFAVIIAILFNGLRIALIGVLTYFGIGEVLHGPYHILQAMSVSIAGFIVLFIGAWILSDRSKSVPSRSDLESIHPAESLLFSKKKRQVKAIFILTTCILVSAGVYVNFIRPLPVPMKTDLVLFPYKVGSWTGTDGKSGIEVFKTLKVDHDIARTYRTEGGKEVSLYIGYYEIQYQGKELIHNESEILHQDAVDIHVKLSPDRVIKLNRIEKGKGAPDNVILFWYELNGRIVTSRYWAKAYTVWDVLAKGRSNGAVILVSGESSHAENFVKDLIPLLNDYLP